MSDTVKNRRRTRRAQRAQSDLAVHPGFTLVELLVALGLVSLLMLLFAQVFQVATETMSTQRGIMENDQRARAVTMNLTHDLDNRTMRAVVPFQPGEVDYVNLPPYRFANRQGFFSISENEVSNDAEDVLSFTVQLPATVEPFYGKATALPRVSPIPSPDTRLIDFPNQPDADDFSIQPNAVATSTAAEVAYFIRNGNLYRRVMLIREPTDPSTMDRQPNDAPLNQTVGADLFTPANNIYPSPTFPDDNFWADFDFSARFALDGFGNPRGARFLGGGLAGVNPLDNGQAAAYFPIGIPLNRFGHNPITTHGNTTLTPISVGNPREFVGNLFIGRLTHEETSHPNFNYPNSRSTVGTIGVPTDPIDTPGTLLTDANANSVIDQFEQGSRRGEDILLSNVHAFDVKVWDEIAGDNGDYVDIGHKLRNTTTNQAGDFFQDATVPADDRNRRPSYGPFDGPRTLQENRVFDTWHPQFDANADGTLDVNDRPPFLPKLDYTNYSAWATGTAYTAGPTAYVLPTNASTETFLYRCIQSGTSGVTEPIWPTNDTQTVTDGSVIWQAVYNLKRMKSLKITIRYLDVSSDQMRQVTLIQSLME